MEETTIINNNTSDANNEIININEETTNIKDFNDNCPQFNIIETNVSPSLVSKISSDILVHIFKYSKNTGTIDLNNEYENILMSKKINILEYLNINFGCNDIYDIKCTGVRIKKIGENIKNKISQWLMHDEKYYVSFYFYIATPSSLFEAYLLVITGKKNAIPREQLTIIENTQKKTNSVIIELENQINISINKLEEMHNALVKTVQIDNYDTRNQITTINDKLVQSIDDISTKLINELNNVRIENNNVKENLENQITITKNNINKLEEIHNDLVQIVEIYNDKTENKITTLNNQLIEYIENISTKSINKLNDQLTEKINTIKTETDTGFNDLKVKLATNVIDTQKTIKDVVSIIDIKLQNIAMTFKEETNEIINKLNGEINNINVNINTQEININKLEKKLEEITHVILHSEGDDYVVVK